MHHSMYWLQLWYSMKKCLKQMKDLHQLHLINNFLLQSSNWQTPIKVLKQYFTGLSNWSGRWSSNPEANQEYLMKFMNHGDRNCRWTSDWILKMLFLEWTLILCASLELEIVSYKNHYILLAHISGNKEFN